MFNKLYVGCKNFLKENYKELIFLICFYMVMIIPVPYYIFTSGGTLDLAEKIELSNNRKVNGSYNLSYVSSLEGRVFTYLLSYVVPGWERIDMNLYKYDETEEYEDILLRDQLDLRHANQTSIEVAFKQAGLAFEIKEVNHYVVAIIDNTESDIKIGDIVTKINGVSFSGTEQVSELIRNSVIGDEFELTLLRDKKEIATKIKVKEIEGEKKIGLSILPIYDYETDPKVSFYFADSENGSSGGLMVTLALYDLLVEEDLSKGRKIVGTGTIDSAGNVGPIGGVKYKLKGAVDDDADIFLVPRDVNYDECLQLVEEKGYDIKIVPVSTIEEAINVLKE